MRQVWGQAGKSSQWIRVRAREIREQPEIRLQHSLKAVPEQNRVGGWKQGEKLLLRLQDFKAGHQHHYLCACWVQAAKPQGEADELSALILVTATDGASLLCLFWGRWKRTARHLVIIVSKMSQIPEAIWACLWIKAFVLEFRFILFSFWNLIQHDMLVPKKQPVSALLTASSVK